MRPRRMTSASYVPQSVRCSTPYSWVMRMVESPTLRPLSVRQPGGDQMVKNEAAVPLRNEMPTPCGVNLLYVKYQVGCAQPRQRPYPGPHAACTCAPVAPRRRPPKLLPGTTTPCCGSASARTAASVATTIDKNTE